MNISDMENANRNRLLDIVQRIPAGIPDGWEKTTYTVGGGLRRYSNDGNTLMSVSPFWPAEKIIFMPNYTLYTLNPEKCTIIFEDYEIKAFGFSKLRKEPMARSSTAWRTFGDSWNR